MRNDMDQLELIREAQLGNSASMDKLSELMESRVRLYIRRLMLNDNDEVAEDLTQDTLLEVVKCLKNLQIDHRNQFWAWLFKIANTKIQAHYKNQQLQRRLQPLVPHSQHFVLECVQGNYGQKLKKLMHKELSETILQAMKKLNPRHRTILILRCLEQMPYSEIASIMNCPEIAVQILFYRAKQSLKHQLSHAGLKTGTGWFLTVLTLFAQITTSAEALSTAVTVTPASIKVSPLAMVVGTVAPQADIGIVAATIATIVFVGAIIMPYTPKLRTPSRPNIAKIEGFEYPSNLVAAYDSEGDGWMGSDKGRWPTRVTPESLIGVPASEWGMLTLGKDDRVELKFSRRIVDGPGDDILLTEIGTYGEQAHVFITDANGNEYFLGTAQARNSKRLGGPTKISFDISGISLPFVPCGVRILGTGLGEDYDISLAPGFDLRSVRARITSN
jgi:RNA polymerase sigma-70 factor (ECF subfamily)